MIFEAECKKCGEGFVPQPAEYDEVRDLYTFVPDDLVHGVREDGEPCMGPGVLLGAYTRNYSEADELQRRVQFREADGTIRSWDSQWGGD